MNRLICYYVIVIHKYSSSNPDDKIFCLSKVKQTFYCTFQEATLFSIENKDGGPPAGMNQSRNAGKKIKISLSWPWRKYIFIQIVREVSCDSENATVVTVRVFLRSSGFFKHCLLNNIVEIVALGIVTTLIINNEHDAVHCSAGIVGDL